MVYGFRLQKLYLRGPPNDCSATQNTKHTGRGTDGCLRTNTASGKLREGGAEERGGGGGDGGFFLWQRQLVALYNLKWSDRD